MKFSTVAIALMSISAAVSAQHDAEISKEPVLDDVEVYEETEDLSTEPVRADTDELLEKYAGDEEDEDEEADVIFVEEDNENEDVAEKTADEDAAPEAPFLDGGFLQNMILSEEPVPENESNEQPKVNYAIDWTFTESNGNGADKPFEFSTSENGLMNYTFVNHEEEDTTIYAVSGQIIDPQTRDVVANVSVSEIGPIFVAVNESVNFMQNIGFDLPEGVFYVLPYVHVGENENAKRVSVSPKLVRILPAPLSFFNFEFLSILVTLALISYSSYNALTKVNAGKSNKKELKAKAKTATIDTNAWIPENHKK